MKKQLILPALIIGLFMQVPASSMELEYNPREEAAYKLEVFSALVQNIWKTSKEGGLKDKSYIHKPDDEVTIVYGEDGRKRTGSPYHVMDKTRSNLINSNTAYRGQLVQAMKDSAQDTFLNASLCSLYMKISFAARYLRFDPNVFPDDEIIGYLYEQSKGEGHNRIIDRERQAYNFIREICPNNYQALSCYHVVDWPVIQFHDEKFVVENTPNKTSFKIRDPQFQDLLCKYLSSDKDTLDNSPYKDLQKINYMDSIVKENKEPEGLSEVQKFIFCYNKYLDKILEEMENNYPILKNSSLGQKIKDAYLMNQE